MVARTGALKPSGEVGTRLFVGGSPVGLKGAARTRNSHIFPMPGEDTLMASRMSERWSAGAGASAEGVRRSASTVMEPVEMLLLWETGGGIMEVISRRPPVNR